jgi:hypothetical protein
MGKREDPAMRLMSAVCLAVCLSVALVGCGSWNDGPFGYQAPRGDRGGGEQGQGQVANDQVNEGALRLQNVEAARRQTPMETSR